MIREKTELFRSLIDMDRMERRLKEICSHHRLQTAPGYHDAAQYVIDEMKREGIAASLYRFPAVNGVKYGDITSCRIWDCRKAMLWIDDEEKTKLCDYSEDEMCVCMCSCSCDFAKEGLELYVIPEGTTAEDVRDVDLTGKLVLVWDYVPEMMWLVEKKGAAGFVTDRICNMPGMPRSREMMPDARGYVRIPFENEAKYGTFGFVITPRQGKMLRELCAAGNCVKLKGMIDVEFRDGFYENVIAEIPGKTDRYTVITAHLCHPKPSANDNASGCAAAMEAMTVLHAAIERGLVPVPECGIRMILIPEYTGSYAYVEGIGEEGRGKYLADINIDMVGGKKEEGTGPVCLSEAKQELHSFADCAAGAAFRAAFDSDLLMDEKENPVSNNHYDITGFTIGSDNEVWCNYGIPGVTMTQWPYIPYHTSMDTPDHIDYTLVGKCASAAAAAALAVSDPDRSDSEEILLYTFERYMRAVRRGAVIEAEKEEFEKRVKNIEDVYGLEENDTVDILRRLFF